MLKPRTLAVAGFVLFAALLRVFPHPWNFSPIGAMALFGGAQFRDKRAAFLIPLAALFLGDIILGFYPGMWVIYGAFAVIAGIGMVLGEKPGLFALGAGTLASSLSFYLITNFNSWLPEGLYPKTFQGMLQAYEAGIPFFRGTCLGDACYVALLFGGFALAQKRFPVLQDAPEAAQTPAA